MVRFLALLCSAAAFSGCGGDDDGPVADAGAGGVVAQGEVRAAMLGSRFEDLAPIEGATVCAFEHPEVSCVTTSPTGAFELRGLPLRSEVALSFDADGYQPALLPLTTDERPILPSIALEPDASIAARNEAAGATPAAGRGSIGFVTTDGSGLVSGVSAASEPAGDGPFYVDADHAVDTSLDATSTRGFGFVLAIAPGTAVLRFTHPTLACHVPVLGWPDGSGGVRAPVADGYETSVAVLCEAM